jgi:Carboxypeptidase regulatory-like domain
MDSSKPAETPPTKFPPSGPTSGFTRWIARTRERSRSSEQAKPSKAPGRRWKRHIRFSLRVITGLVFLAFLVIWGMTLFRRTTELQGALMDPLNRPIAGARLFLVSNPAIETTTDEDGAFRLERFPVGHQSLVAAVDGAGQEYRVEVLRSARNNLGRLTFHVPRRPSDTAGRTGNNP